MINHFLHIDRLSTVMITVMSLIFISIAAFSKNYFCGDKRQIAWYLPLAGLLASLCCTFAAAHLALLFVAWCWGIFFVILLLKYKSHWPAAEHSLKLTIINASITVVLIGWSFTIIYTTTGASYIAEIMNIDIHPIALVLLIAAALAQSALLPFHTWLLSSLNSTAPALAIIHGAFVGLGGFFLLRFAPVFAKQDWTLWTIFIFGITTAVTALFWELIQTDVKGRLSCSTITHMGLIFAEFGLGLFWLAQTHIFLHTIFKTYLFLSSASAAERKSRKFTALATLFFRCTKHKTTGPLFLKLYMSMVNASQPNQKTITPDRNQYRL
jgi:NAD(P)H-quinone oxidoreductase subunit 5